MRLRYLKRPGAACSMLGAAMVALHLTVPVIGDLTPWGFGVMLAGSLLWAGVGVKTKDTAVLAQWTFFTALNLIGIWRWRG